MKFHDNLHLHHHRRPVFEEIEEKEIRLKGEKYKLTSSSSSLTADGLTTGFP
jgi:hypothetical protein